MITIKVKSIFISTIFAITGMSYALDQSNRDFSVGTPQGSFSVSEMGAAVYSLNIEVPNGGPLAPQIGLVYNSQMSGYGLAGYGMNISGFSIITHGGKNLFHDGVLAGVTYTPSDNLYLDGQRLILKSGISGKDGAVYIPEGNPYTKVTEHVKMHQEQYEIEEGYWTVCPNHEEDEEYIPPVIGVKDVIDYWYFDVCDNTGSIFQYGNTIDSRLSLSDDCVVSWHVNRVEDRLGNYMTYQYDNSNFYTKPVSIEYGYNSKKNRGIVNRISFEYQSLGSSSRAFILKDKKGEINTCLSSITTSSNNTIFRKYSFTYDGTSDKTPGRWTRLVSVTESNGVGEKYHPITFDWNYLTDSCNSSSKISVSTSNAIRYSNCYEIKEDNKLFFSTDLNADGISDIVRVTNGREGYFYDKDHYYKVAPYCALNISTSNISSTGAITYVNHDRKYLPTTIEWDGFKTAMKSAASVDFDGDGKNEMIIPYYHSINNTKTATFITLYDANEIRYITCDLTTSSGNFQTLALDFDGDGKGEIICVEENKKNGTYPCFILKSQGRSVSEPTPQRFSISLPASPKKIFTGDFNNDGLMDIIILTNSHYKIFYNEGGTFSDNKSFQGWSLCDHTRVEQGDFNGDGQVDFIFAKEDDPYLYLALNQNNGTSFSSIPIIKIAEGDQTFTSCDDDKYAIRVWDANHDGFSDVMICKSDYDHRGFPYWDTEYKYTKTYWLVSNGNTLIKQAEYFSKKNDSLEGTIFLGDFDGDGYEELANYGNLLNEASNSEFEENRLNIYKVGSDLSGLGKITCVTDGMGNKNVITYSFATNPSVYKCNKNLSFYPVNTYVIPLSLVKQVTLDNGSLASQTVLYKYENLLVHIGGRGMLGFTVTSSENPILNTKNTSEIIEWNTNLWMPQKVRNTFSINEATSVSESQYSFSSVDNTYFTFISSSEDTDMDGNKTITQTQYIDSIGVIKARTIYNDGNKMYKKVSYSEYVKKGGSYLPTQVTMEQKHSDDDTPYSSQIVYTYNDLGQVSSDIVHAGTEMALETKYTYDVYGNLKTTESLVAGNNKVYSHSAYDSSGRFVTKSWTVPASIIKTFAYDLWGNVLSETDETNPAKYLVTQHTYDGWGREIELIDEFGIKTQRAIAWGNSDGKKYQTIDMTDNAPIVTTWYDKAGRKVEQSSVGLLGIQTRHNLSYNNMGLLWQEVSLTGELPIVRTLDFDDRGRITKEYYNSGRIISYSYGNRSISTTLGDHTFTQIYDAWGNVIKSIDPANSSVIFQFHSNGKPKNAQCGASMVTMTYDVAGNQTSLTDPDAGTMTYTYATDGSMLSKKDSRGIETINTYDNLGRIKSSKIGDKTITYDYWTSGNGILRLRKQSLNGNAVEYEYDSFGRISKESRTISGFGTFNFQNTYNNKNQLVSTSYPGGLTVGYRYDNNGFKTQMLVNGQIVIEPRFYNGKKVQTLFMNSLKTTNARNDYGTSFNDSVSKGSTILANFEARYDVLTNNLISRKRNNKQQEYFSYDSLDRLISVKRGNEEILQMGYAANGNITSKSDIGTYVYGTDTNQPHAVRSIDNLAEPLISSQLNTTYNAWNKVESISLDEYSGSTLGLNVVYGPDQERWHSNLTDDNGCIRSTIYAGNYEKVTENGETREFYYLDSNVIVVKYNGTFNVYLAVKDHLGSYVSILDSYGDPVFEAEYDVWGKQVISMNEIGFQRGYTGHEMWNEFGIINMNGRLYDSSIGRFLSPDNYIQSPVNAQNFNRYSYCLNNPLKYTDPSGNFWEMVLTGAIFGAIQNGAMSEMNGGKFWKGAWKGALIGGASSAAGMYVGAALSSCMEPGLLANAAIGACAGGTSAFINGAGLSWSNGASLTDGLITGVVNGVFSSATGAVFGGLNGNAASSGSASSFDDNMPMEPNAIYLENVNVIAYNQSSYNAAGINIWNQIYRSDALSMISTANLYGGYVATMLGSRGDYKKDIFGEFWKGKNGKWYNAKDLIKSNGKKADGYNFLKRSLDLAKSRVPKSAIAFGKLAKGSSLLGTFYDGAKFVNNPSVWGVYNLTGDAIGYFGGVPGATISVYMNSLESAYVNVVSGTATTADWFILKGCNPNGYYSISMYYGIPQ